MSKERELLKTILAYMCAEYLVITEFEMITQIEDTVKEIQNLLAQPEQATLKLRESSATQTFNDAVSEVLANKPVAWKGRTYGNLHHVDYGNSIPLYTSPPTREPLSDSILSKEVDIIKKDADFSNVRLWQIYYLMRKTEELHGIGVDDEK